MKNDKISEKLCAIALPLLTLFLLLMNLLSGCGARDGYEGNYFLGKFDFREQEEKQSEADLLCLVNPWNPLPDNCSPILDSLSDGTQVDHRCIDDLRTLLNDCRGAGCSPYICSAYRSTEKQNALFENKVNRVMNEGFERIEAEAIAAREVARPGTSEHQLGLAVDIIDSAYTALDEGQAATATQLWLMENSWRYGFILRYPEGKSEVTGIIYEPWHYRYVGQDAAKEIYESGLCLEEWLDINS